VEYIVVNFAIPIFQLKVESFLRFIPIGCLEVSECEVVDQVRGTSPVYLRHT